MEINNKNYVHMIDRLRASTNKCSSEISEILSYFVKEANAHSSGIPKEIEREIDNLSHRFFTKCSCTKAKDQGDEPSTYKGGPYFSETGTTRGYGKRKGPYTN